MSIEFQCGCGKHYKVDDKYAARKVKCKACGAAVLVPNLEADVPLLEEDTDEYDIAGLPPAAMARSESAPVEHDALSRMMVNNDTFASNPAQARFDPIQYFKCYPEMLVMSLLLVPVGILGGILAHWGAFILVGAPIVLVGKEYLRQRAKLISGDVCPAIVVSDRPYRIAVYTNLTTGRGGAKPAILIADAPLKRMAGGPPQVGDGLATVALYAGDINSDAWLNFEPTVLACATRDLDAVARVTQSISPSDWAQLKSHLSRITDRRPAMHKIWLGERKNFLSKSAEAFLTALILGAMVILPVIALASKLKK